MFKRCSKCREMKPREAFNRCTSKSDGLQSYCRECLSMRKSTPPDRETRLAKLSAFQTVDELIEKVRERRVVTAAGCWEFTGGHTAKGYPLLTLGSGVNAKLHRLACAVDRGLDYNADWLALHSCPGGDNAGCWNPAHLRPGTNVDNLRDAFTRGGKRGTLLSDQHDLIVEMRSDGKRLVDIAAAVGCSRRAVSYYLQKVG